MSSQATPFPQEKAESSALTPSAGDRSTRGAALAEYDFFRAPPMRSARVRRCLLQRQKGEFKHSPGARLWAVAIAAAFGVAVALELGLRRVVLTTWQKRHTSRERSGPRFLEFSRGAALRLTDIPAPATSWVRRAVRSSCAASGDKLIRQGPAIQGCRGVDGSCYRHFRQSEYTNTDSFRWFPPPS
jgi:hypothetical protein